MLVTSSVLNDKTRTATLDDEAKWAMKDKSLTGIDSVEYEVLVELWRISLPDLRLVLLPFSW